MLRGWGRVWGWLALLVLLGVGRAYAMEVELFKSERFQGGPWVIRADVITYDADQRIYTAQGEVDIRQGERRLRADYVEVHEATKVAFLKGNVVLVLDDDIFSGAEGRFNLATRSGEMQGARLFLKRNHFHVEAPLLRKTGDQSYFAESAVVTTCDADRPAWSFAASNLTVVMEGYATAQDARLKVAGLPVLYLPAAALPVVTARQSGILLPSFGQHKAGGTVVEAPLYWAISNYADATFYQNYLSNRGYMQGAEARWKGGGDAGVTARFYYLDDGNSQAPTNHRFWAAGMANLKLPGDVEVRSTWDRVSDAAYLKDFNFGYMGLNRYSRELLQSFGRDLEQQEVNTRVSSLLVSRNFSQAHITAYGRYYQNLNPNDPMLSNRIPGVSLYSVPLRVAELPLFVGLDSSYNYFYQNHAMHGDRMDLHPQMWLQGEVLPGISFSGRSGFRETLFRVDKTVPGGPPEKYIPRQLFDSQVSLSGNFARDYGREGGSQDYYRHVVRPEVFYWNMPRYNPRRYPDFDPFDMGWVAQVNRNLPVRPGDDPLGGVNALTYGISNTVLARGQTSQGQATVRDVLWLRLSQSAFFNKTSMGLDGTSIRHHPFSDFWGEMEFYPFRQLTLGANAGVSPYQEGFERADFKVTLLDAQRQNYINVNYVYVKNFAKQINVETYLNLFRSVKTWLTFGHTFETERKLEQRYGVVFQQQCWGVSLTYTERPDDKRVGVIVFIPGLSEKLKRSAVRFPEEGRGREGPDLY